MEMTTEMETEELNVEQRELTVNELDDVAGGMIQLDWGFLARVAISTWIC